MKPDLIAYDHWTAHTAWGDVIRRHNERRTKPPTPKSGQRSSRSAAPSPVPQDRSDGHEGLAPAAPTT